MSPLAMRANAALPELPLAKAMCALAAFAMLSASPAMAEEAAAPDLAYRSDRLHLHPPAIAANSSRLPPSVEDYLPAAPAPVQPQPKAQADEPPSPTPYRYAWDRVRAGFVLPDLDNALVAHWQNWYQQRPKLLEALFERSRPYVYHVAEEIDQRKLPMELALLPMVESGYDPLALSSARASGLWQFIPATGKAYSLEQGLLRDARRDIVASTAAALTYLQAMHQRFGDWQLAIAAYNCGEAAVERALARNKSRGAPANFSALALPEETRNYLPKLQALKNIVARPGAFAIRIAPVPNRPYFTAIKSERYIDVDIAAKLANMSLEDFLALNPSFKLNLISKGPRRHILLPVDKVDVFLTNLDNYREPPRASKDTTKKTSRRAEDRQSSGRPAGTD